MGSKEERRSREHGHQERAEARQGNGLGEYAIHRADTVDRNIGVKPTDLPADGLSKGLRIALSPKHQPHVPGLILGAELVKDRLVLALKALVLHIAHHTDDFQRLAPKPKTLTKRILTRKVPAGHRITNHRDSWGGRCVLVVEPPPAE